jgi:NAD(P)-dependent dehydrogenase (short-subunit alcohol dehydrogenase family)
MKNALVWGASGGIGQAIIKKLNNDDWTTLWDKVSLRLPSDAASPEKVADKIIEAYEAGHKGQLDLV